MSLRTYPLSSLRASFPDIVMPNSYQLAVNNINNINGDCTNLVPGQVLCLGTKDHDCQTTHVVGSGDTCDAISSAAGVNNTLLSSNNPQINGECSNIYVGEVRSSCAIMKSTQANF